MNLDPFEYSGTVKEREREREREREFNKVASISYTNIHKNEFRYIKQFSLYF